MNKFIITPKDRQKVQLSIKIEKRIKVGFDNLAKKSGHKRNKLINLALDYALKNAAVLD